MKLVFLIIYLLAVATGLFFEWKKDGKPRIGVHNFKIALVSNAVVTAIVMGAVFMN